MPSVVLISCGETVAQLGAFAFAAGMTTNAPTAIAVQIPGLISTTTLLHHLVEVVDRVAVAALSAWPEATSAPGRRDDLV
jgi:hypothetical protein